MTVLARPRDSMRLTATFVALMVAQSAIAEAAATVSFRLSNQGSSAISRIDLSVFPSGAIVPPVLSVDPVTGQPLTGSPLTILDSSFGFERTTMNVALGSREDAQVLRLLFGQTQQVADDGSLEFRQLLDAEGNPRGLFAPGATLDFSVYVDEAALDTMRLELPLAAAGVVLQTLPVGDVTVPPPANGGESPPPSGGPLANQIPEPAACLLWGALGGGALMLRRGRTRRRG